MKGPDFLDGWIIQEKSTNDKWSGKLRGPSGNTLFRIKYYGTLHAKYPYLIAGTSAAPAKIEAIDNDANQQILLFDCCKNGYNALFCDTFSLKQVNRTAENILKLTDDSELFEITISARYRFNFDEEFGDEVDDNGMIEIIDGSKMSLESVKRNGFDSYEIFAFCKGKKWNILSEELA